MACKSPSKFFSLKLLLEIKENNYYLKYDYQPEEVDQLIWIKQQKLLPIDLSTITDKKCTLCLKLKPLEEFHIDSSKKLKRRSHCKHCRKPVPF